MQIAIEKVAKSAQKGLRTGEYILLLVMEDQCHYLFDKSYFNEFYLSLQKKELIKQKGEEFQLTEKAIKLLEEIGNNVSTKKDIIDYKSLNLMLKERLQLCYGSKQVVGFGGIYFIPTVPELQEFLGRFWKHYPEMRDIKKIMYCLEKHIIKCSKQNKFAPAIKYFIYKQGTGSQLANAYDNFEEEKQEIKDNLEPKEIKNLF